MSDPAAVDGSPSRAPAGLRVYLAGPLFSEADRAFSRPGYRGIVGLVTDWRAVRRRGTPGDGLNLFVAGAVAANGELTWDVDAALDAVDRLAARRPR